MSRFAIALALVASLTTSAFATHAYAPNTGFARAPELTEMDVPEAGVALPQRFMDRTSIRAKLVEQRAANLARFRAYQKAGVFPVNTVRPGMLNVWVDSDGHICAAATIIKMSGLDELVQRTGEQNNFIRLADVKQGPLMDWMLTSGFTQEEIAAIQAPFAYPGDEGLRINDQQRARETARLTKLYKQVTAKLVKNQKASLEIAVSRLMKHSELAWRLLDA
jgi:hypothetical protein